MVRNVVVVPRVISTEFIFTRFQLMFGIRLAAHLASVRFEARAPVQVPHVIAVIGVALRC